MACLSQLSYLGDVQTARAAGSLRAGVPIPGRAPRVNSITSSPGLGPAGCQPSRRSHRGGLATTTGTLTKALYARAPF